MDLGMFVMGIVAGLVAGRLAGIVEAGGYGLMGDLVPALPGSIVVSWLFSAKEAAE